MTPATKDAFMTNFPLPLPMPPMTDGTRRDIRKARRMMETKGLTVEIIDEIRWKVTAPDGASLLYFPLEQRWRKGSEWGGGVRGAVMALAPDLVTQDELGEVISLSSHPEWRKKMQADYRPFVPSPESSDCEPSQPD
jgi:hypothetical protein